MGCSTKVLVVNNFNVSIYSIRVGTTMTFTSWLYLPVYCVYLTFFINPLTPGRYGRYHKCLIHYADVIMIEIASQITSHTVVYSTVYSDADQRKHQSSASLAFVWGIHRDRWIPRTKGQLRGKCFHLMTSSWKQKFFVNDSLTHLPLVPHMR